jgi:hypothetical protein
MGLSTDTLLHQTSFESLKKILYSSEFNVNYSIEKISYDIGHLLRSFTHVFPMVSFSEIPISSLHNHLNRYGPCIIGMKKSWALTNRFNQVHYYQQESKLIESLITTFSDLTENEGDHTPKDELKLIQLIEFQLAHSKNYIGSVITKSFEDEEYCFAEEKEWRFVPPLKGDEKSISRMLEYYNKNKATLKNEINKEKLKFTLSDVDLIITENEIQKTAIRDILKNRDINHEINLFTNEEIKKTFLGYNNIPITEFDLKKEVTRLNKIISPS